MWLFTKKVVYLYAKTYELVSNNMVVGERGDLSL